MHSRTELYKKIIVPIIKKHAPKAKVILYGSRARGDNREGSDIDIALDEGSVIDAARFSSILEDIEESKLPITFDIVDFRCVSAEMQKDIEKEGVVWQK